MSLVWVGFLAFFVVALVVGIRLVALSFRTRHLPELLIGIGVLGIGPVGFGLLVTAQRLDPGTAFTAVSAVGSLAVVAGVSADLVFNWRVYHPASPGVRAGILAAMGVLALAWVHSLAADFADYRQPDVLFYVRALLQIGTLLWGAGEAFRYWGLMKRRARLGLGDPVVANRFLLWGIGTGAAGVGSLIGIAAQIVLGVPRTQEGWVLASSSLHGLTAAVAMWLAFLPPEPYLRFVRSR